MKKKCLLIALAVLGLFCLLGMGISSSQAAKATKTPKSGGSNPYNLIAAVNSLRAAQGLPPYQVNSALMAAAQAHSNYQASIYTGTHEGPGGSRPRDRAAAAGYGGGATIFISENIAWGMSMNVQTAVSIWQGDSLHLNTMLGANYTDAGAGVASSGGATYYTLDVGYISGSPGSGSTIIPSSAIPQITPLYPIVVATPLPDGSIVHIVQPGQSLWSIAAVYKISLADLQMLNKLTSSNTIYIGQKILIKPPEITATGATTVTSSPQLSTPISPATRTPTSGITKVVTSHPALTQVEEISVKVNMPESPKSKMDPFLLLIAGLIFSGTALVILGSVINKNR
jgi:uncharacterized protein YkwD